MNFRDNIRVKVFLTTIDKLVSELKKDVANTSTVFVLLHGLD